jgi:hypothetical protein
MNRSQVCSELGADESFARRMENDGVLPRWPAPDGESYRARLRVIVAARRGGVTLATVRRALGGAS